MMRSDHGDLRARRCSAKERLLPSCARATSSPRAWNQSGMRAAMMSYMSWDASVVARNARAEFRPSGLLHRQAAPFWMRASSIAGCRSGIDPIYPGHGRAEALLHGTRHPSITKSRMERCSCRRRCALATRSPGAPVPKSRSKTWRGLASGVTGVLAAAELQAQSCKDRRRNSRNRTRRCCGLSIAASIPRTVTRRSVRPDGQPGQSKFRRGWYRWRSFSNGRR